MKATKILYTTTTLAMASMFLIPSAYALESEIADEVMTQEVIEAPLEVQSTSTVKTLSSSRRYGHKVESAVNAHLKKAKLTPNKVTVMPSKSRSKLGRFVDTDVNAHLKKKKDARISTSSNVYNPRANR